MASKGEVSILEDNQRHFGRSGGSRYDGFCDLVAFRVYPPTFFNASTTCNVSGVGIRFSSTCFVSPFYDHVIIALLEMESHSVKLLPIVVGGDTGRNWLPSLAGRKKTFTVIQTTLNHLPLLSLSSEAWGVDNYASHFFLCSQLPIQRAILYRFSDMVGEDFFRLSQIGNRSTA